MDDHDKLFREKNAMAKELGEKSQVLERVSREVDKLAM